MRFRMDWRSVKFDWNRARAFLVTAEEGSLSAAARALGMAQPTLGRQVDALEEELGVVLFERAGRHPGQLVGRSPYMQAVHVDDPIEGPGAIVRLVITAAYANSLKGVVEIREAGAGSIGVRSVLE